MIPAARLAWRNTGKNIWRRMPLLGMVAISLAILVLGNSLLARIEQGLAYSYRERISGAWSLSAPASPAFGLFGTEVPLVEDFQALPTIPHIQDILPDLTQDPAGSPLGVVSGKLVLDAGGGRQGALFLGADPGQWFQFFPAYGLVPPPAGTKGLWASESLRGAILDTSGQPAVPGTPVLVTSVLEGNPVVREVPLAGYLDFGSLGGLSSALVLVDIDTGRAMNRYLQGQDLSVELAPVDAAMGDVVVEEEGSIFDLLPDLLEPENDSTANLTIPDAYNFLLFPRPDQGSGVKELALTYGLVARDWRGTVGGMAQVVWLLSIIFTVGMLAMLFLVVVVLVNAMVLSVLDRTKEWGTMRALGARRGFVVRVMAWESFWSLMVAGLSGTVLGLVLVFRLRAVPPVLGNALLESLFGGDTLVPLLTTSVFVTQGAILALVWLLGTAYPAMVAVRVSPQAAMTKE